MLPIKDTIPRRNPPIATWVIIFLNCFVFLLELTMSPYSLQQSFYLFGIVPARFTHPDWAAWVGFPIDDYWPFLTSMFLHGGWLHIIGNMWTLWIFGDNVEDRMGPVRFVFFYLLCGIAAVWARHMDNNIFTQIGFVVLAGMSVKNAVLIVEFAKQQQEHHRGMTASVAAIEAARLRLRPILMTSFAFIFGVIPLIAATGAGAEMRQALGTVVFFGMIGVTFFGVFLTPVFYTVIRRLIDRRESPLPKETPIRSMPAYAISGDRPAVIRRTGSLKRQGD